MVLHYCNKSAILSVKCQYHSALVYAYKFRIIDLQVAQKPKIATVRNYINALVPLTIICAILFCNSVTSYIHKYRS